MPFDSINVESEVTNVLRRALARIMDPDRWTQGINHKKSATFGEQWCSVGAINAEVHHGSAVKWRAARLLASCVPRDNDALLPHLTMLERVKTFNDNNTHRTVVRWWQRAIDRSVERDLGL